MKKFWLFKSEPSCYSIDDLQKDKVEPWDGIRNYQARNFLRDECAVGELGLFYHSSCQVPAAVGVFEIVSRPYPDHTAFDPNSEHPDPKSDPKNPRWFMVDVKFIEKFKNPVPLSLIKNLPECQNMRLVQRGNRLSVFPIRRDEFEKIKAIGR